MPHATDTGLGSRAYLNEKALHLHALLIHPKGRSFCHAGGLQGMELVPQNLKVSRRRHVQVGRLPGAAQLQAAGQLPQRLIIPHEDNRNLLAGVGALQTAMPLWQLEAARHQRQARGGGTLTIMYCACPRISRRCL